MKAFDRGTDEVKRERGSETDMAEQPTDIISLPVIRKAVPQKLKKRRSAKSA
jgi:hypothetical protein